jgi:heme/copper-type cytochrome/quinol oxidase subunit 3
MFVIPGMFLISGHQNLLAGPKIIVAAYTGVLIGTSIIYRFNEKRIVKNKIRYFMAGWLSNSGAFLLGSGFYLTQVLKFHWKNR